MTPLIIANWKMNLTLKEAVLKAEELEKINYSARLLLAPPALYLGHLASILKKTTLCAQDVSSASGSGAYTGENSSDMIKSCGVNHALIGHSERRTIFKESNNMVKTKVKNCLKSGVTPIVCIGESLETRQNKNYKEFLIQQIAESIPENAHGVIIGYEPVWAIGSGIVPTPEEIAEVFDIIKTNKEISLVAKNAQLVYGGSVNSKNYKEILAVPGNNGLILGSASLKEDELNAILN